MRNNSNARDGTPGASRFELSTSSTRMIPRPPVSYCAHPSELTFDEIAAQVVWLDNAADRPGWARDRLLALLDELERCGELQRRVVRQ